MADPLLAALADVVGPAHVVTDPAMTAGYAVDWTGRFRGAARAVVRPGATAEVAEVLDRCRRAGAAVVPQGGNTGLVGGSVPLHGEVVLSLRRLAEVAAVDELAGQVTAASGTTLATVEARAAGSGLAFGVDLGARDSATIGGMIATNAGGLRLLRYGPMRAQVLGVEAALADGSVISHLGGLVKDNTGYDLAGLMCGSEGTLGVVTAARLRLVPAYERRVAALLAFPSTVAALEAVAHLRTTLPVLEAAELFFADGVELVCETLGMRPPFGEVHEAYVLAECADHGDPTPALAAAVDALATPAAAVAVADDTPRRRDLWRYREGHTEALNIVGPPVKLDVTLPAGRLADFVPAVRAVASRIAPAARTYLFGHAADGNLHVNVVGVDPDDRAVEDAVLRLVASMGGSISAEHGVGTAKRAWLHLNRSDAELAAFRAIKRALDPDGVLNPHVLLP